MYTDNCANTTLLGDSWIITEKSQWSIDIIEFAKDLQKEDLPIMNAIIPNNQSILLQVNDAAYMGEGDTLLSKNQVRSYGIQIDDDPYFGQGVICLESKIGEDISLHFKRVLTFIKINCPSNSNLENLDTLYFTST